MLRTVSVLILLLFFTVASSRRLSPRTVSNCDRNVFIACINKGDIFEMSETIANVGNSGILTASSFSRAVLSSDKYELMEKMRGICQSTQPIINCLSENSCLDDSEPGNSPAWSLIFEGASDDQSRLMGNWVKSLRYLPIAYVLEAVFTSYFNAVIIDVKCFLGIL